MKKVVFSIILLLVFTGIFCYAFFSEKRPIGSNFEKADQLTNEMLKAINDSAWQKTMAVEWTFRGANRHLWDRERHFARVQWKSYEVLVDLSKQTGIAYKNGQLLEGKQSNKMVLKAWKDWCNDSFWLNPISKATDDGTTRSIVELKSGENGLMVSYDQGGATPGDSYVWLLDDNNLPYAWKMWVSIIPIGGIKVPWSGWITTETGVKVCNLHSTKVFDLKLENVRMAHSLSELTNGEDPFTALQ